MGPQKTATDSVKIFLVEDNLGDVGLVREVLRERQITAKLEHYENGQDARAAIASMTDLPDLVLIDINVPRISGLELLAIIRSQASTAGLPTAVLTSSQNPADKAEAERLDATAFIVKPLGFPEFMNDVGAAIQGLLKRNDQKAQTSAYG
jgi:two-component system, chemotaxis family, response regulator Rcp1